MKEIFDTYIDIAFDPNAQDYMDKIKRLWHRYNFLPFFPTDKEAKVLDIGPGRGEMLSTMKEFGYTNIMSVDISPSVVEYCRAKGYQCELAESTEQWLSMHKNEFELITLLDVLEHIPKDRLIRFVKACYDALTETGRIIIEVPNLQSPEGFLHRYNDITHEVGFVEHTLGQVLMTVGFKEYRFYPFEEFVEGGEEEDHLKKIRAFYWKLVTSFRKLTHNLEPRILTPEFFCVASRCELVEEIQNSNVLLENDSFTLDDLRFFCTQYGLKLDLIEMMEQIKYIGQLVNAYHDQQISIEDLKSKNNEMQEQLDKQQNKINDLLERYSDLNKENDIKGMKIEGLALYCKQLEKEIQESRILIYNLEGEADNVRRQYDDLRNEVDSLTKTIENQNRILERIPRFILRREK